MLKPLSNQEIIDRCPAIGSSAPHARVSGRYQMISSLQVIDMLRDHGWFPTSAKEAGVRSADKAGYQKHMIRFQHPDLQVGDEAIEAVLINSHDRSCAYKFFTGVFRFICSNGMIVGDTFEKIAVRHIHLDEADIIEASFKILENAPVVAGSIAHMKQIQLSDRECLAFAEAAQQIVYDAPEEAPFRADRFLYPRRYDDRGKDLWRTLNIVQENIIGGKIRGYNKKTKRHTTTKAVKCIDKDVKLNRALWTLAERMREIKTLARQ